MSLESTYADRVFRKKNIHLVVANDFKDPAELISEQRAKSQAIAVDIARLCAKASSISLGKHDHAPTQAH